MEEQKRRDADSGSEGLISFGMVSAAHEMKSPLALIRQLALIMQDKTCDDKTRQLYARQIALTSERSLRITNDLLSVSTLQTSLFPLEPLNPLSICQEVAEELGPLFDCNHRSIEVVSRRSVPLVIANRQLFFRVIAHFVDNALKYAPQSGTVQIMLERDSRPEAVRVAVRDYGPGVSARVARALKKNTQPFFYNTPQRPEGSGVGLYVAQQFAASMGSTIGVTRHADGASFYIAMPRSRQMTLL